MIHCYLFFNGHAGAGLGLFFIIVGVIALVLVAGLLFLIWRYRSVTGLKYAGALLAVSALSQLVLSFVADGLVTQAFASLFSLPWYRAIEVFLDQSDASSFGYAIKVGAAINALIIYLAIGVFKRINAREASLR